MITGPLGCTLECQAVKSRQRFLDHLRAGSANDDAAASSPRSNNWLWLPVSRYLLDEIKAVSGGMAHLYCDILIGYTLLCMCMTVWLIMVRVL